VRVCPPEGETWRAFLQFMERTLKEHISSLENRIEQLNAEMMEKHRTQEQINEIESELRAATLARNRSSI